jgi:hypothetical protein
VAPESKTHRIAVLQQDNGELQEDVVERSAVEQDEGDAAADEPGGDGADEPRADRVVHSTTVGEVAERSHPAQPVPGTIPRSEGQ